MINLHPHNKSRIAIEYPWIAKILADLNFVAVGTNGQTAKFNSSLNFKLYSIS